MSTLSIVDIQAQAVEPICYHADEQKRVEGNPQQTLWDIYSDPSEQFGSGIWQAEKGCWKVSYSEFEYCHILEGYSVIIDDDGGEKHVKAGDHFVIPAGFEGQWRVIEATRKIYVIYEQK
jgi:hypothetical protein